MSNPWAVLALLCLARVSMGLHLQSVAAIAPFMIADLGFSYADCSGWRSWRRWSRLAECGAGVCR